MLAYYDQSAPFMCPQTHKHPERPITLPLVRTSRARGNYTHRRFPLASNLRDLRDRFRSGR